MKAKLLAIILSIFMLVQPVMAVGMVSMESAEEVSDVVEVLETAEETTLTGDSNVPENAVVFDDFESYNAGDAIPASFSTVYNTTGLTDALKVTADGTMSIAEFDGSKVIKNTKTIGQYYNIGFKLNNIPAVNVGKYELTFDAYLVYDGTNAWDQLVTTNITSTANYYLTALGDYKNNNWNTYKITFDVTESDGTKTCVITYCNGTTKTIDVTDKEHLGVEAHMYFTNKGVGTSQTYYLDNVALTYKAPYVPTNVPAGAILYEDFGGVEATAYGSDVAYSKNFSYAAEGYSSVTMNTYSTMTSKYMDFNGDMVLVEKPTKDYRIGMGFTGAALPDGEYVYTVNLYPVTVVPKSFTMRFQGGTQTDINLSNIGATLVAGDWNTLKYPFTIYTEDGTRKIKICNTSATTFTGTLSVQNFGTQSAYTHEFYFDDISLVKVIPATVTYLDESGATLGTISTTVGETFTVGNGISVAYTPVYTINGEKVNAGDVVTVTGDMTVNVAKYVPENIPANAIVYEDFEGYADGAAAFGKTMSYDVSTAATKATLAEYYTKADTSLVDSLSDSTIPAVAGKGGKAFKLSNRANAYKIFSFYFMNLPAKELGEYTLSFKAFVEESDVWQKAVYLHYNGAGSANNSVTLTPGTWQTFTIPYEIKMVDGVKTCICKGFNGNANMTFALNGDNLYKAEIRYINSDVTVADKQNIYVDDICVTYKTPATITYIGEGNTTLKTISTTVGETATIESAEALGLEYLPVYTINGETVSAGDTLTLTGDVTVNVAKYVPANIPANAIFFEDFDYYAEYADTATRFSNYGAYTSGQAAGASIYETYDRSSSTQSIVTANGSKVFKQSDCEEYSAGFGIGGIKLEEPGTYTLSFKYLATLPEESTATKPQFFFRFMNTGTALISDEWSRVYVTDLSGEEWKTYSKSFEIYYEDGAKKIKSGIYSAALPATGITALAGFYIPNGNHIGVTYYDDICLTYEYKAPAVVNAYFVTENGEEFAYNVHSEDGSLVLPTAAQLGVDYTPCYKYNDVTYYPGQTVSYSEDTDAEFVVSRTNIIYKADFDSNVAKLTDATADAVCNLTVADGKGYYAAATTDGGQWNTSKLATGFNISTPGKYTIYVDLYLDPLESEASSFATYFYMYGATASDGASSVMNANWSAGQWNSIVVDFVVYEKDGSLYYNNVNGAEQLLKNGNITQIGFGGNVNAKNTTGARMYVDNFIITYDSYNPALVNKASYRVKDENGKTGPAGIRFAAYVTDTQYDACTEYGFVVTRKTLLGGDYTKLNLKGVTVTANGVTASANADEVLVVAAAAYDGKVTRTYTHDGATFGTEYMGIEETFFTGILTGIPSGMEAEVFVGRPYIKIDGNIYYGNCIERCYNDFFAAQNS